MLLSNTNDYFVYLCLRPSLYLGCPSSALLRKVIRALTTTWPSPRLPLRLSQIFHVFTPFLTSRPGGGMGILFAPLCPLHTIICPLPKNFQLGTSHEQPTTTQFLFLLQLSIKPCTLFLESLTACSLYHLHQYCHYLVNLNIHTVFPDPWCPLFQ